MRAFFVKITVKSNNLFAFFKFYSWELTLSTPYTDPLYPTVLAVEVNVWYQLIFLDPGSTIC